MTRTITYHITDTVQVHSVKAFLMHQGYSSRSLIELKKLPENILVNQQPVHVNHPLHTGDILTVHIQEDHSSEKILPVDLPLDIVYEDEDLLVINKPAGMPIHPSMNHYENSLANALAWYFTKQDKDFVFRCVNRLDKDTSGLTVVAKHFVSAGILSDMISNKTDSGFTREYLAIVRGNVKPLSGTINAPIARKEGSIMERQIDWEQGESAITHYQLISEKNGHSLVSLTLDTGRTHQIRVHMKYLGFPLIGDYLYHPDMELISRQALHSHRVCFTHPITGEQLDFSAPLPEDMAAIIR